MPTLAPHGPHCYASLASGVLAFYWPPATLTTLRKLPFAALTMRLVAAIVKTFGGDSSGWHPGTPGTQVRRLQGPDAIINWIKGRKVAFPDAKGTMKLE